MAASWSIVAVSPTQNEKRWVMQCNGLLTFPTHQCFGPLGVSTATGTGPNTPGMTFSNKAALLQEAYHQNWWRNVEDVPGTIDYCVGVPTE